MQSMMVMATNAMAMKGHGNDSNQWW